MAELLKGAPVAAALNEKTAALAEELKNRGIVPTLAILRVGEREDDLSYERGATKRCTALGIQVKSVALPAEITGGEFFDAIRALNIDDSVHGILMLRPLPKHIDEEKARKAIAPDKDVDGCGDASLAGVFENIPLGFAPCTAQAVMEILDHYGIDCRGKSVAVIGRSLVVGRPVAMLLMHKNATVTICHTGTPDVAEVTKRSDIVIACAGQMESIGKDHLREGQVVIDVGIHWNEEKGKLCGDVKLEEVETLPCAVTPVPGGVGAVTTAVLAYHTVMAAAR